jgi:hypothetical protein
MGYIVKQARDLFLQGAAEFPDEEHDPDGMFVSRDIPFPIDQITCPALADAFQSLNGPAENKRFKNPFDDKFPVNFILDSHFLAPQIGSEKDELQKTGPGFPASGPWDAGLLNRDNRVLPPSMDLISPSFGIFRPRPANLYRFSPGIDGFAERGNLSFADRASSPEKIEQSHGPPPRPHFPLRKPPSRESAARKKFSCLHFKVPDAKPEILFEQIDRFCSI